MVERPRASTRPPARASRRLAVAVVAAVAIAGCVAERSPGEVSPRSARAVDARVAGVRALGLPLATTTATAFDLALPATAAEPVRLTDATGAVSVAFTIRGARGVAPVRAVARAPAAEVRVYPGAIAGADLVHAPLEDGVEDLVFFDAPPASSELTYELGVGGVAGLRLVGGNLEMLDALGAPRLRLAEPFLIDRDGRRHAARLRVDGCAIDRDEAPPWGRPITAPGAVVCRVVVAWGEGVAFPAVLDPAWTVSSAAFAARYAHTMTTLPSGQLLVTGGYYDAECSTCGAGPLASADLFDPATRTWAAAGGLPVSRVGHAAALLPSGLVALFGGGGSSRPEVFTGSGFRRSEASMAAQPVDLTATTLPSGKVLVAGGRDGAPLATALLFDDLADTFSAAGGGAMTVARARHTATRLPSGRVLVAGGSGAGGALASAEVYDPVADTFTATPAPMSHARSGHVAALLADGRVLLAGGETASAEIYDPATGAFTVVGSMASARAAATAVVLESGRVMVAGGSVDGTAVGAVEIYDPVRRAFAPQPSLALARHSHTAARLATGEVFVVGGRLPSGRSVRNPEIWSPGASGAACSVADDCRSGACQGGACCAGPCDGACKTCVAGTGACVAVVSTDDPDSCTGADTCDAAGACKKKNGQACGAAAQCASGHCVDGWCCDRACGGQCEACDVAGHAGRCIPVVGESHGARPRCAGGGTTCGGSCNGSGVTACAFPSAVTTCGTACATGKLSVSTCDGRGACVPDRSQACPGNFACSDEASCRTDCTTDRECASGYRCEGVELSACAPIALCDGSVVTKGTEVVDCAPYACEQSGACRTTCASVADCAEAKVCSRDGLCVDAPPPTASGCAVRGSRDDAGRAFPAVLLVLAVLGVGRGRLGVGRARLGVAPGRRRP